jgi:Skp family chaperone for outer membrane proteins
VSATLRAMALALAALLTNATASAAEAVGYVDVARAVAAHPFHPVLAQYDREIAALRGTLEALPSGDPTAQAQRGAAALARGTDSAQTRLQAMGGSSGGDDRSRERTALTSVRTSQRAADRAMATYSAELVRETRASVESYRRSIAERNARALAARRQQLHERELTLAFDLARAHAGKRLTLRLKLDHLHLDGTDRRRLGRELAALNADESRAVAAMRRTDAGVLAAYERELERDGAAENARMAAQLRANATANLALRRRVLRAGPSAGAPDLSTQAASFAASYRSEADARTVADSLRAASDDVSKRFALLAASDRASRDETVRRIRALRADRNSLYQSILARIRRASETLLRERHLSKLELRGKRPAGSVDLTPAVETELARR